MKTAERHHLKQNEFAETTARVASTLAANRDRALLIAGILVLVLVIVGGYFYWRKRTNDQAGALLGMAMSIQGSTIAPPPTVPGATQQAGTFPTEQARAEATLKALQEVAKSYPSTEAALTANFQIASEYLSLGRLQEAEQAFKSVIDKAGSSIYGPMARLGLAETMSLAGRHDEAIKAFSDLAAQRDGALPVDGVLMQLAQACEKAGKTQDARAAFKRVVDEFPESGYAATARQRLAALN